jgi:hypothetical protein
MLSPKNHIRGKNMHAATAAGAGGADLQPNKKAGVKPAFSIRFAESEDQYLAMTGPPNL